MSTDSLVVNGISIRKKANPKKKSNRFLTYYFANQDKELNIQFIVSEKQKLDFVINEVSNDLLTNPKFKITPRDSTMMPMPFVTNDAIITSKKLEF